MTGYYEFFAGGGMARAGLGLGWNCLFANDIDEKKCASYVQNWGGKDLHQADVKSLKSSDLPGRADLAWASFPCQDLSLAGSKTGLNGKHSGTFWPFWELMLALGREGRAPTLVVLENVCGALTSHDGRDFAEIGSALGQAGYRFGAVVVDAIDFVPQSRPRLFVIAVHRGIPVPRDLIQAEPAEPWHTGMLVRAYEKLPPAARSEWLWWHLPQADTRQAILSDLVQDRPEGVRWHTVKETRRLLDLMSLRNRKKVASAKKAGCEMIGTVYRRTRLDENGKKVQRAEVLFDKIAGCLRTARGGSSRQTLLFVYRDQVRSRLLSPREMARLMGLPDDYQLPENYNDVYHLAGDGVVVPVVRHLAKHILEPVLGNSVALKRS